ncbi:Hypothetical protein FKW44_003622 [Caligus rogercresseyi]|uniref:Uncharacterized protein n=1 Tax=Caligus rogercresseyi TaxID=217165 RepID=A0A7T8QX62_CALRO|nr:Hypothetical protein FKW44_003622 [Caligus rogercresseyi]
MLKQATISALKAMNVDSCPLERILESFDEPSRSASINLKKPVSSKCNAACQSFKDLGPVTAIKRGMHVIK